MVIRPYKRGDEEGIVRLRRSVFGDMDPYKATIEGWKWEFGEIPSGSPIIVVAEEGGEIVGHYGLLPMTLCHRGKEQPFGLAVDLMVHPLYRRRGLFVNMYREVERKAREEGLAGILGFPNERTLPTYKNRLGWKHLMDLSLFFAANPIFLLSCIRGYETTPSLPTYGKYKGMEIIFETISRFENAITPLDSGALPYSFLKRDPDYLNWRYIKPRWYSYRCYRILLRKEPLGYFVIRNYQKKGLWFAVLMDIFPFPLIDRETTKRVFKEILAMLKGSNIVGLIFSDSIGFFKKFLDPGIRIPSLLNPRPWHVGWRDLSDGCGPVSEDFYLTFGDGDIL
ncbi:MAG: GNAT family N-acetyltransferase [Desulfatiglandales bacterium]